MMPSYPALRDDHYTDEVRIVTVPRFKTSELSGDEWRFSYRAELRRKGQVWASYRCNNLQYAALVAAEALHLVDFELEEKGWEVSKLRDDGQCMNPGCEEPATVEYRLKARYCRDAHKSEPYGDERRRFCERHSRRGDCGFEDADANYETLDGKPVDPRAEDLSPSSFGGVIQITAEPAGEG